MLDITEHRKEINRRMLKFINKYSEIQAIVYRLVMVLEFWGYTLTPHPNCPRRRRIAED